MFEIIVKKEGTEIPWLERSYRPIRRCWETKHWRRCPSIMQAFIEKAGRMWKRDWILTGSSILHAVYLSSPSKTLMWYPVPAVLLIYKGMFLVGQLRTFFQDLQSPDYESAIALVHSRFSHQHQCQAGSVHIRTASLYITVRSILSKVMRIRCWPARRTWNPSI